MKHNDAELIQRILTNDDDDAFSSLVEKYQKQVHALAWRILGDFHIAEEITQDAFLKAYMELKSLKEPQRFGSWMYVITRRLCMGWLRKKRLRMQSLEDMEQTDNEQLEEAAYAEYIVEEKERTLAEAHREVVKKLLAKLQESERTVMTLFYFGDMSCTEIGEFLGVSANTIKSRLRRAQERLKKEEPMIRETLEHFKITPNLTDNIMREVSRTKPAVPSGSKPLVPWLIAASTVVVVLLMLGIGNSKFLALFQQPYNFDANSEMTVDIIEAPIVANLALKPDQRKQLGSANAESNNPIPEQTNDTTPLSERVEADGTVKHYSQWELPEKVKARLGKGGINAMQYSPNGNQLAVGSSIGTWLYDVKTGKELHLFPGSCGLLAFSPDGRYLVNGGSTRISGGEFQLWDTTTFRKVALTELPPKSVALRFDEDGKTLISIEPDYYSMSIIKTISTINTNTKQVDVENVKEKFGSRAQPPYVYTLTQDKVAIGVNNGLIEIWDTVSGTMLSVPNAHADLEGNNFITALSFSPDGKLLASGNNDTTVSLWRTDTGKEVTKLPNHHSSWITTLAFSPDGKYLASGSKDTTVQLWHIPTGESLTTFTAHIGDIATLAFSPDSNTLATGSLDGTVRFWNIKTRTSLPTHITGHTGWKHATTFSKDSSTLASVAEHGTIALWNLKTLQKPILNSTEKIKNTKMGDFWSLYFAFSSDGTKVASISRERDDTRIRLTDVITGQELTTFKSRLRYIGLSNMVFSPDGKMLAVGDNEKVHLWKTETGEYLEIDISDPEKNLNRFPHSSPPYTVTTLVFSPDGKKIVSGTMAGKVQMWDVETGVELTTFLKGQDPEEMMKKHKRVFIHDPIDDLAFSSNGDLLAVSNRARIHLFGIKKQGHIDKVEVPYCRTIAFSPDDTVLVTGLSNGKIRLWDLTTGDKLNSLEGHKDIVQELVFSHDGKTLTSIGREGTILLWDWDEIRNGSTGNEDPFEQFADDLNFTTSASSERKLFTQIAEIGKNTEDKEGFTYMLNQLIRDVPPKLSVQLNAALVLAEFYREIGKLEKADEHIQKTGFITEDKWLILGPFDNTNGSGFDKPFISENAAQIDTTAKYNGLAGNVRWQKSTDNVLNGYISLGDDVDWGVSYAFATVTSPDKREVQFRFDSDDQGKIWLNGEEVFTNTGSHSAEIDRNTIPVTLNKGRNSILVKVCDEENGWGFYLRITDTDGTSFSDLIFGDSAEN